jgi:hypothetical protein
MLVEGRIHQNMWFILRNMAWAGPEMAVYIFCSDQNYDYIINHSPNGIIPEGSGIEIINFKSLEYFKEKTASGEILKRFRLK